MPYKNREEQLEAQRRHYRQNKSDYMGRNKKRREERRQYINEIKANNPCVDCGNYFHYSVMQFDHLDSDKKKYRISRMIGETRSWEDIDREIAKCELVCANCHSYRTWQRVHGILHT